MGSFALCGVTQTLSLLLCGEIAPTVAFERHTVLPRMFGTGRVCIVGDVHGCYDELMVLVEKLQWRPNGHVQLVLVGDLVNKGPKSAEVVRWCRENKIACVRGNHDVSAMKALSLDPDEREPQYAWCERLAPEDIQWLERLPCTLSIPWLASGPVIVVHAGLVPSVPLEEQTDLDILTMRSIVQLGGAMAGSADEGLESWAASWPSSEPRVVFGHDAKRKLQKFENAIGLDTGCCYGGALTALRLPEDTIVQVKALRTYAPKVDKPKTSRPRLDTGPTI